MSWFRKKNNTPPDAVANPHGVFSTDFLINVKSASGENNLRDAINSTFQKTIKDFVMVNESGVAMDGECSDLVQAKMVNSRVSGIPATQLAWFAGQGFIGWQTCAMLSQNWLIDKACSMPANDACRHGYELTVNDGSKISPDVIDYIRLMDKKMKVLPNCVEFIRNGRIFGIRIAMFDVTSTDPEYYEKPFNPDGITAGSYKGISQIDPYWVSPELSQNAAVNPSSRDFYEPTWWRINGMRVHRTHLVIMRNGEVPDILKPSYFYGGIPVPQKISERVYAAERTANEAPMLAMNKRMTVLSIDMSQAVANQEKFSQKMEAWTEFMNNYGVKIVGEKETIEQFDTSLADFDSLIMTQFQLVAAASNVPSTKLLGTSPKGFNATGAFEEASYHEELESMQEHILTELVDRHHLLLIRSNVCPKFNIPVFDTGVNWLPVNSSTAVELADINLKISQTDNAYVAMGALDGADVRSRLIADKDSGYNGLESIDSMNSEKSVINSDVMDSAEFKESEHPRDKNGKFSTSSSNSSKSEARKDDKLKKNYSLSRTDSDKKIDNIMSSEKTSSKMIEAANEAVRDSVDFVKQTRAKTYSDIESALVDIGIYEYEGGSANSIFIEYDKMLSLLENIDDGDSFIISGKDIPDSLLPNGGKYFPSWLKKEDLEIRGEKGYIDDGVREDFYSSLEPVSEKVLQKKYEDSLKEGAKIESLEDIDTADNHSATSAAFKILLDELNVDYRGGSGLSSESHYFEIPVRYKDSEYEEGDYDTIKIRFSDHENQSSLYAPANLNMVSGDKLEEAINYLRSIYPIIYEEK